MNAPSPQSFDIIFAKRDALLALHPNQSLECAEIIATCEVVQGVSDGLNGFYEFCNLDDQPTLTYTRG